MAFHSSSAYVFFRVIEHALQLKHCQQTHTLPNELAELESLNCGKTINDSIGDMQGVVNTLRYYGGWADKIEGRTVPVRGTPG